MKTTIKKFLNENNMNDECSFPDALRMDFIEKFLKDILDDDVREELSEEPDFDMLLEPDRYIGYDYQTYIQYVDDKTFKFYEGFSKYCWGAFKNQPRYKNKTKKQIIVDFIDKRAKKLGLDFGYELSDGDFYIHDSEEYKDYILILTYKKIAQ